MAIVARREKKRAIPDLFDWADNLPGMFAWPSALGTTRTVRLEEFTDNGRYVVRAELPGIDPDKDVQLEVDNGVLRLHAERKEEQHDDLRSEFHYGSYTRQIMLPEGADEDNISATYNAGILEISIPMSEEKPSETKQIPIQRQG